MQLANKFTTPQPKTYKNQIQQEHAAIKQQIDDLLKHQFQLINTGKYAKRLTTHNSLFLEYIRAVYGEYNIGDPLGQINWSQLSSEPSAVKTIKKQKIHLMSNHTLRYSASPRISSIISDTPLNITQLDKSNHHSKDQLFNQTYYHSLDKIAKQQHHSLDDLLDEFKIHEDNHPSISQERPGLQMIIQQQVRISMEEDEQNTNISTLALNSQRCAWEQKANKGNNNPELEQAFRYCVGCQKPIGEANLRQHEESCHYFQTLLSMPDDEAIRCLTEKVDRMKQKLYRSTQQIGHGEVEEFKQSALQLAEEAKTAVQWGVRSSNFRNYYRKAIQMGNKWCTIPEQASRIHWFLRLIHQQRPHQA